jgi:methionyl-tRNA formyltransferase
VRLVFLGSPAFALPSLEALRAAGHEIALVVTQPDRPAGRGQKPTPPPVAAYAQKHDLAVWQTSSLKGEQAATRLRELEAEAMALAAFAALVPGNILDLTPGGILNVHPSLLPRWRGAAPIQSS